MKITLKLLILSFLFLTTFAGTIYVVDYKPDADVRIYVTTNKYEANLWVYVTNYKPEAKNKDEIWFYSNYKFEQNTHKIIFVKYKSDANLVIYFVTYKPDAQWHIKNQFVGRFK